MKTRRDISFVSLFWLLEEAGTPRPNRRLANLFRMIDSKDILKNCNSANSLIRNLNTGKNSNKPVRLFFRDVCKRLHKKGIRTVHLLSDSTSSGTHILASGNLSSLIESTIQQFSKSFSFNLIKKRKPQINIIRHPANFYRSSVNNGKRGKEMAAIQEIQSWSSNDYLQWLSENIGLFDAK